MPPLRPIDRIMLDSYDDPLPPTALELCNEEHHFQRKDDHTFVERCTALLCRDHIWGEGRSLRCYARDYAGDGGWWVRIWIRAEPQPDWSDFPCVTGYPPDHHLQHAEERAQWLRDSYVVILVGSQGIYRRAATPRRCVESLSRSESGTPPEATVALQDSGSRICIARPLLTTPAHQSRASFSGRL